jgi:hypothetical protein
MRGEGPPLSSRWKTTLPMACQGMGHTDGGSEPQVLPLPLGLCDLGHKIEAPKNLLGTVTNAS